MGTPLVRLGVQLPDVIKGQTAVQPVLFPEDVARIWTEEATAAQLRKFVGTAKAYARRSLENLADKRRPAGDTDGDRAVGTVRDGLSGLLDSRVRIDMPVGEVVNVIDTMHSQVQGMAERLAGLDSSDPRVRLAREPVDLLRQMFHQLSETTFRVVPVKTVYSYVTKSRPPKPGTTPDRYADNPVPEAKARRGARQPAWLPEQEQELRDWWRNRPGPGPRKKATKGSTTASGR